MTKVTLNVEGQLHPLEVEGEEVAYGKKRYRCLIEQRGKTLHVIVKGKRYRIELRETGVGKYEVRLDGRKKEVFWEERRGKFPLAQKGRGKGGRVELTITSPMPGKIVKIEVKKGSHVRAGDVILTLEAMKMENSITTSKSGVVKELLVEEGSSVNAGTILAVIKEEK